jgi:3-oxoacyl-(acyl-carrier-protein) synthase
LAEYRVAVTGMGVVTSVGIGLDAFWQGLVSGKNGISRLTYFDVSDFPSTMASEVKDFDPEQWIDRKSAARMDRFSQFAVAASAMAMADAGLRTEDVGYINAHGTSTVLNDKFESAAILAVFGSHAQVLKVSSNRSMIGHLLAAAGAVEFAATVMSVHSGIVPPTINYEEPDPDCPLDYVTRGAERLDLEAAISNSFGFGGGNACLAVKKFRSAP